MIRWGEVWTDNCFTTCQCWLVNFSGDVSSSSFHSRSALWSWQEYTTSTLCFMELWPWVSVNSHSISRTVQLGLFCRRRGYQTPSHYSASCTGCLSNSGSVTSWLCWHWQFASLQCRRILESTSQNSSESVDSSLVISDCTHQANLPVTAFVKRAFHCFTSAIWNTLPSSVIDKDDSLPTFKTRLKTFLLRQHWQRLTCHHQLWSYDHDQTIVIIVIIITV